MERSKLQVGWWVLGAVLLGCGGEPTAEPCASGFRAEAGACVDVDECAEAADRCGPRATCANTPGAFTCTCLAPLEGDGATCRLPQGFVATLSHPADDAAHRAADVPEAAADGLGGAMVVLRAGGQVWARHHDAVRGLWAPLVRLDTEGIRPTSRPHVAMDASGRAAAAWVTPGLDIVVAHFTPAGGWRAPQAVVPGAGLTAVELTDVAMDAEGRAVVAFAVRNDLTGLFGHYVAFYTPEGTHRAELSLGTSAVTDAALAVQLREGFLNVALVWMTPGGDLAVTRGSWWLAGDRMASDANAERLLDASPGEVRRPQAAYDTAGRLHVAWARAQTTEAGEPALFLEHQWLVPAGQAQPAARRVGALGGETAWALVAGRAPDEAALVWASAQGDAVWSAHHGAQGWSTPGLALQARVRELTAALDVQGRLQLVWSTRLGEAFELWGSTRDAQGAWTQPAQAYGATGQLPRAPALCARPTGGTLLVWTQHPLAAPPPEGPQAVLGALWE